MWSMLLYLLASFAIAASLMLNASHVLYIALLASLAGFGYSLTVYLRGDFRRKEKKDNVGRYTEEQEMGVDLRGREELERQIDELQEEIDELRAEKSDRADWKHDYAKQCVFVAQAVEAERILSRTVIDKTENATNELTDNVYSLAGSSREVGEHIQEALGHFSTGDGGLKDDTEKLEQQRHVIEQLISEFQKIRDGYTTEMETIEATMKEVDSFTDTITDLSERTSVLAINASIEAARAGNAGKGFAVIASEVQKLAGNTRNIAEQINTTVEESVHKVKASIEQYGTRIEKAVGQLEKSGREHSALIDQLNPQIEKISNVVYQSQQLSDTVTEDLNEVTVHLQYQDAVRQILEHMIQLLEKATERGKEIAGDPGQVDPSEVERLREEMRTLASRFFTTREEWEAFGYDLDENLDNGSSGGSGGAENSSSEEFEGDVTLF